MSGPGELPMPREKLANYASVRGAEAYKHDHRSKLHRRLSDRWERRILERFFGELSPCGCILDLPCGAGRLFTLLRSYADSVIEADWSPAMLELNKRDHDNAAESYLRCSALEIPLSDRRVDVAVSVRLSHHFDSPAHREQHLSELFRVADRAVIVTWFSRGSLKNWLRRWRAPFNRKRPKNTMAGRDVAAIARSSRFEPLRMLPLSRLGSGHVFGLFRRSG
ncbi:MAG: class I SAM-dependent methyltransferase [Planctomycetota bacterium]